MHYVKFLELVAIKNESEKTYLHLRLYTDQQTELYWEIDDATAINIKHIYENSGNHKYRLSLNSMYNNSLEQYVTSLTKTYRELSEPIYFDCSIEFRNGLETFKNCQSIADLISLPYIFTDLPLPNESTYEVIAKKRMTAKSSWIVAIISVMFIVIAVSSHHLLNKATLNSTVVVAAQPNINITPVYSTIKKNIISPATTIPEDDSTPFSLPNFTVDESLTYSIPEGYVALTFDDGPSKFTISITNILKEYGVGGTFFFLGANAKKHPESVRYVLESGYSIGNHSMNHSIMTKLTIEEQEDDLLRSTEVLEDITDTKMHLYRPPYGATNEQITDLIHSHGYKIIQWNKDPEDWKTQDSEKIINYVLNNKASGSIIILHESQAVIDALPTIIESFLDQDLQIVNLQ